MRKVEKNDCSAAENVSQICTDFVSLLPGCSSWFEECSKTNVQMCAVEESASSSVLDKFTDQQLADEDVTNQTFTVVSLDSQTKLQHEPPDPHLARSPVTSVEKINENSLSGDTAPATILQNESIDVNADTHLEKPSNSPHNVSSDKITSLPCDSPADMFADINEDTHNPSSVPINSSQLQPQIIAEKTSPLTKSPDLQPTKALSTNEVSAVEENIDFVFDADFLYDTDDDAENPTIQPVNCSTFFAQAKILESGNQSKYFELPTSLPDHPVLSVKQFYASQYCPPATTTSHNNSSQAMKEVLQNSFTFLFPDLQADNKDEVIPINEQKSDKSHHKDVKSLLDEDDDWFDEAVLQQLNSSPLRSKRDRHEAVDNIENKQPLPCHDTIRPYQSDFTDADQQMSYSDTTTRKSKTMLNVNIDEEDNHLRNTSVSPSKTVQAEVTNVAKTVGDQPFRIESISQILKESKLFNSCDYELFPGNIRLKRKEVVGSSNGFQVASASKNCSVREADQTRHYEMCTDGKQVAIRTGKFSKRIELQFTQYYWILGLK